MTKENEKLHDFSPDDYDLFPNNEPFKDGTEPQIAWINQDVCIIAAPAPNWETSARVDFLIGDNTLAKMVYNDDPIAAKHGAISIANHLLRFIKGLTERQQEAFFVIMCQYWDCL